MSMTCRTHTNIRMHAYDTQHNIHMHLFIKHIHIHTNMNAPAHTCQQQQWVVPNETETH